MEISYQNGFGNHFSTEAISGTLPVGQNSPRRSPKGLFPEQLSGTAFTMDRSENLRTWLYRTAPSVLQTPYTPYVQKKWTSIARAIDPLSPNATRWEAPPLPDLPCSFLDGIQTLVAPLGALGCSVHQYQFCKNDDFQFIQNHDGEMVLIPEKGKLLLITEMGRLFVSPKEIAVVPRGIKFQVLGSDPSGDHQDENFWYRGYLGENTGEPYRLPNLGPLGANGLANPRDFQYPRAWFKAKNDSYTVVSKFQNHFWQTELAYHPCNVVAWHGNYSPYKYNLESFNTMGSVSFDHPDPSIYTVLTSPSPVPGRASSDFVIFPPRWLVAENTFRPPYFHKNMMSEFMGLIDGVYDAKEGGGFIPGGCSLHNSFTPHGPDSATYSKALEESDEPRKVGASMAFMFEAENVFYPSDYLLEGRHKDPNYISCWQDIKPVDIG